MISGLPENASGEGWRIDSILRIAHWATLIISAIVLLWLLVILLRSRKKSVHYTHGLALREKALPLLAAAMMVFGVDGFLLLRSHRDMHQSLLLVDQAEAEEGSVRVQIAARQWAWDVRQSGVDGKFGSSDDIYSVSELVVPVGAAVVFELTSTDVVHSLYLPQFRIKQDAIPGAVARGWFRPTKIGDYEIACAQHCGVHHFQMRGVLRVVGVEDYAAWQRANSVDFDNLTREDRRAFREEEGRSVIKKGDWPEMAPARDWAWPWTGDALANVVEEKSQEAGR